MNISTLHKTAKQLVSPGKGILAADESSSTIAKRLATIDVKSTIENRLKYRELLLSSPNIEKYISGVILFEETLTQANHQGDRLVETLSKKGIIPGVKVDKGLVPLSNYPNEKVTEGLDGLKSRLDGYAEQGAQFSKWRAVMTIGEGRPSDFLIECNALALARFAAISQQAGLVPIVEPEILMEGAHTLEQCEQAATSTLIKVFDKLHQQKVSLEGMLLKASMITAGMECTQQASVDEVCSATLRVLSRTLPIAVPGVVFLSGGQNPVQATTHLNALNRQQSHPWELSFSFGRALQEPVLKSWAGKDSSIAAAQQALYHRAMLNGAARSGEYSDHLEL
jgi:fructose-bisphosphate aldolase class I